MSNKKFILKGKALSGNRSFIAQSISSSKNQDGNIIGGIDKDYRKLGILEDLAESKKTIIGKYKELTERNQEISNVKNQLVSRYKNLIELDNKLSQKFNGLINEEEELIENDETHKTDNYSQVFKNKIKRRGGVKTSKNAASDSDFQKVQSITNNYQEKISDFAKKLSKIQGGIDKESHDSEMLINASGSMSNRLDGIEKMLKNSIMNDKKTFDILKLIMDWANSFHNAESKLFSSTSTFINETQKLKHDISHLNNILIRIDERDHDYFNLLKKVDYVVNQVEESKKVHENYSSASVNEIKAIAKQIDLIKKTEDIQLQKSNEILHKEDRLEEDHKQIDFKLKHLEKKESTIDKMINRLDKDFKKIEKETEVIVENQELASEITSFKNIPEKKIDNNFPGIYASKTNAFFVPDHNISLDVGIPKRVRIDPTQKKIAPTNSSTIPNRTVRARIHMLLDDINGLIKNKELKKIKLKLHDIKYYYDMLENNDPYKAEVYNKVHSIKNVISN